MWKGPGGLLPCSPPNVATCVSVPNTALTSEELGRAFPQTPGSRLSTIPHFPVSTTKQRGFVPKRAERPEAGVVTDHFQGPQRTVFTAGWGQPQASSHVYPPYPSYPGGRSRPMQDGEGWMGDTGWGWQDPLPAGSCGQWACGSS